MEARKKGKGRKTEKEEEEEGHEKKKERGGDVRNIERNGNKEEREGVKQRRRRRKEHRGKEARRGEGAKAAPCPPPLHYRLQHAPRVWQMYGPAASRVSVSRGRRCLGRERKVRQVRSGPVTPASRRYLDEGIKEYRLLMPFVVG